MPELEFIRRLINTGSLTADFRGLTGCGGRLIGSASEQGARTWLERRLSQLPCARLGSHAFEYSGWTGHGAFLELIGSGTRTALRCHPLYWSAETTRQGLEADVIDIGRGTDAEFRALAAQIRGNIVIVRHEYPFSTDSIHRRVKYSCSIQHGAAGFIIANGLPGHLLVTGSCGQDLPSNIPALGISFETAAGLAQENPVRVRMRLATTRQANIGVNLIAEAPGHNDEWVVVCGHYDGHDLAQSAFDNATGVAAALAIFEGFSPFASRLRRGLRLILFTAEESGLLGSRMYLQSIGESGRRKIAVVVNLDTIAGSPRLTCLTSDFDELDDFVVRTSDEAGLALRCFRPLLRNSDHFNFAQCGIPAMRVIAGFDEPESDVRFLLTEGDTSDLVSMEELSAATTAAGLLVWSALDYGRPIAAHGLAPARA
ncbi:MAG: M28 family peptidase [Xanthobacteraceae bacterium]